MPMLRARTCIIRRYMADIMNKYNLKIIAVLLCNFSGLQGYKKAIIKEQVFVYIPYIKCM